MTVKTFVIAILIIFGLLFLTKHGKADELWTQRGLRQRLGSQAELVREMIFQAHACGWLEAAVENSSSRRISPTSKVICDDIRRFLEERQK